MDNLIAKTQIIINAPVEKVWNALVDPALIAKYMFGAKLISSWKEGSDIRWVGTWQGKSFEDKGKILQIQPPHLLQCSHFSPLAGKEDKPENYHKLTFELLTQNGSTLIKLTQDGNASTQEKLHSEENWFKMLSGLKTIVEEKQ